MLRHCVLLSLAFGPWSGLALVPPVVQAGKARCGVRLQAQSERGAEQQSRRDMLGLMGGLLLAPQVLGVASSFADEPVAAEGAAALPPVSTKTAFDFRVPYNGEYVDLSKFKGKATLVMNAKSDDPESLNQLPGLAYLTKEYSANDQLKIWVFTTEQGTFETDDDEIIRIKFKQEYGYGQYPDAVVFDKINVVGKGADPLYKYLCLTLRNPNKVARITLNFEKFLLDSEGRPVRRYPRKYSPFDIEPDIKALLAGQPLPPPTPMFIKAWRDAFQEAERSEYAFKKGLNYYDPNGRDMRPPPRGERGD